MKMINAKIMKIKKIIPLLVAALIVVSVASCRKNRYCYCVAKEGAPDTVVVNVDRSMKCDHILEMGLERIINGEEVVTVQKVACEELDVDTLATIPSNL